jgi:hypothetical protein
VSFLKKFPRLFMAGGGIFIAKKIDNSVLTPVFGFPAAYPLMP